MSEKYILSHGIHNGTFMSRDSTVSNHNTYDEAYQSFFKQKEFYTRIGYVIWFADIIAPDGTKTHLESNSNYNGNRPFNERKTQSYNTDGFHLSE